MKIGFTVFEEHIAKLKESCDRVCYVKIRNQTSQTFLAFVLENKEHQLVIKTLEDVGLQLVQMIPALEVLKKQRKDIFFLEQGLTNQLPNAVYNELLFEYAQSEKKIMSQRTIHGINDAKKKGIKHGRPRINEEIIKKIQSLSRKQNWSYREIAIICDVSLASVHKYVNE
ncbi:recombinase family protein [Vagococcus salmoninarum]|uniref:Resolvase/invertase-type recombinase catalytic domain-containing protein n=1 Tax=Vagococcus salmoninarum TaxID=2739 RepID=A0A429ZSQ9_9ENTE|nr:recombinase family protein [Vagococcus salmoninarum]MBE9388746.1 recombinase family protein [Vagococcus salmoninarum]RST96701.1 hypothetical protein CBF35_05570 [Vagococcus salmoninarum]